MKNPNRQTSIGFQVNYLLKEHGIEAKLEEINRLSEIIKNTIEFNQKLYDIGTLDGVSLATTVEDLIDIYMLRSEVYREMSYTSEFPELIKGLDFDEFDECSAIIYSKRGDTITGTCRLIFDSTVKKLPIDENFSLDYLRNSKRIIGEGSRVIIKNIEGLKPEFKLMTIDCYRVLSSYNVDLVSVMTKEHIKLYKNFGGFSVEKRFERYGSINKEFYITLWRTSKISTFFKRVFLRNVRVA